MVVLLLENTKLITAGAVATVSGLLVGGVLWYRIYMKNKMPTEWVKVGEVEELCVYPVKSFKAIEPPSFECTPLGARLGQFRDRSFVVIDGEGKFVTGRNYPKMTQMRARIDEKGVALFCPDFPEPIHVDIDNIQGERKKVKIWGTWTEGTDCGDKVASWLSKCILEQDTGLRLLYCGQIEKGKKVNDIITAYTKMENVQMQENDGGCFSDAVSYHLISQASIKELNSRLHDTQVSALNFRPNLIIKGEDLIPFEEDTWKWVKIGNVVFQCLAPCTRCLFTTVDPNTGEKSQKMEPLESLKRYRHVRNPEKRKLLTTPAMGIYLGLRSGAELSISIGDEVYVSPM